MARALGAGCMQDGETDAPNLHSAGAHSGRKPRHPKGVRAGRREAPILLPWRPMNTDTLKGQWLQLKGQVRKQWGKLTDDDLDQIQGTTEILAGKLQERYGRSKDEASKEIDRFLASV